MNTLEKNRTRRDQAENAGRGRMPRFGKNGAVRSRWKAIPVAFGCLVILIGLCIAAVHIPVLLHREGTVPDSQKYIFRPDESGVRNLLEYAKDHPAEDFDSDGLSNSEETAYGTDPRNPDTDEDGVSDYAEIYLYNTRPGEADRQLETVVGAKLQETGEQFSDPFRIHDVILWADSLSSRSRGTVVPTLRGYRFSGFSGWAQFPGTVHAYVLTDGIHVPLEYREAENAWRVDASLEDREVLLYGEPLPSARLVTFFGSRYYVENSLLASVFDLILPADHSFLTCRKVILKDLENLTVGSTVTGTTMPDIDRSDLSRFGESTSELSSLTRVYSSILSGKPVPVSLQSSSDGEVLCLIYGFTEFGDLLAAGPGGETADAEDSPFVLDVIEKGAITIDREGSLRQREFFGFEGLGFSSGRGDKIHFLFPE